MKKIRFLVDFQGTETRNIFYKKGSEPLVEDALAARMIKDKRAVLVDEPHKPEKEIEPRFEDLVESPVCETEDEEPEIVIKPKRRSKRK